MTAIRTILVPIDFSAVSDAALTYATELASAVGARIHIVHGLHLQSLMTPDGEWWEGVRRAARDGMAEAQGGVKAAGVVCDSELVDAYPVDAILDTAKKIGADLIVMGTHGHTGLAHVLLGSVAERTLRQSVCPVLTVRPEASS